MKWVKSNGKRLEVRDCGPVVYEMEATERLPLPPGLNTVMDDDEARKFLNRLRQQGFKGRVPNG